MTTGATLNRHKSTQDVETPQVLIDAVVRRFGPLAFDLAANNTNAKAPDFFTPGEDALRQDWTGLIGNAWLNPPFGNIEPWAIKCADYAFAMRASDAIDKVLMLVPASIGSRWFSEYVYPVANVIALVGRIKFVGHTHPFPRDLMLCVYSGRKGLWRGFECWDWRGK